MGGPRISIYKRLFGCGWYVARGGEPSSVPNQLFVTIVVAREITVTALRAIAASEGMIIAAGSGGKLKTAFQLLGTIGLLVHYPYELDFLIVETTVSFHRLGSWLFVLSVVFSVSSALQYFAAFVNEVGRRERNAE